MTGFLTPAWLLLLLAVAALAAAYVVLQRRRSRYAVRFSNTELLATVIPKRPGWRRHTTVALLLLALVALTAAMARPTTSVRVPRDRATVILAIDVSLSMQATDVAPSRIEAAQQAAAEFVRMLPPRINLGLVSFAGTANLLVPPTTERDGVLRSLDGLRLAERTAIGEAIFTSISAIQTFRQQVGGAEATSPAPARIVLMSDGTTTDGRPVESAVRAARDAGIPVSTIAFGTDGGTVDIGGQAIAVPADKSSLRAIATATGGTFHAAASADELRTVYRDLGSQIGYTTAQREVTQWAIGIGLLFAFAAAGWGLWWSNRLL